MAFKLSWIGIEIDPRGLSTSRESGITYGLGRSGMTAGQWRYALASAVGTSHLKNNAPCQDACDCKEMTTRDNESVLVAAASDGAGSASRSEVASALACQRFIEDLAVHFGSGSLPNDLDPEYFQRWIVALYDEISALAMRENSSPREFACTFVGAVVCDNIAFFVQVGDGAVVIPLFDDPQVYTTVFWPEHGEYANTTTFVTSPQLDSHIRISVVNERVEDIVLFTDGLERLALNLQDQQAYVPFFEEMLRPIQQSGTGHDVDLSLKLESFLRSSTVISRTDDDKSVVIASRRESETHSWFTEKSA